MYPEYHWRRMVQHHTPSRTTSSLNSTNLFPAHNLHLRQYLASDYRLTSPAQPRPLRALAIFLERCSRKFHTERDSIVLKSSGFRHVVAGGEAQQSQSL